MMPKRKSPSAELREALALLRFRVGHQRDDKALGLVNTADKALDALLARKAEKPQGAPAMVVRYIATARQLAAAVESGHLSEGNKAQARNLGVRGKAVADAVDAWTDGGRREPMSDRSGMEEA